MNGIYAIKRKRKFLIVAEGAYFGYAKKDEIEFKKGATFAWLSSLSPAKRKEAA